MSETTSFLGGAALAGLAAVILLRGGITTNSPATSPTQPLPNYPYPNVSPSPLNSLPPATTGTPTASDLEKQRLETEQLKALVEQQRVQTDQLKTQIQSQQALIDTLTAQNKASTLASPRPAAGGGSSDQTNPILTGLLWALGGMILAFGGGIALVGMFVLFAKQQRPSRTIEVIHDDYGTGYLPARRRSQALPARRTLKRVEAEDLE